MNERIEHCLYQAGLTAQGCWDELDDYAKEGIEKFAKLLVRECAIIADQRPTVLIDQTTGGLIKQHFGIDR